MPEPINLPQGAHTVPDWRTTGQLRPGDILYEEDPGPYNNFTKYESKVVEVFENGQLVEATSTRWSSNRLYKLVKGVSGWYLKHLGNVSTTFPKPRG